MRQDGGQEKNRNFMVKINDEFTANANERIVNRATDLARESDNDAG
jgi:hypothetical protein